MTNSLSLPPPHSAGQAGPPTAGSLAPPETPRGKALLAHPGLNKDSAFSQVERSALGLSGLLPSRVLTIEQQVVLELERVRAKADNLEKYIGLAALQDRNETLFYRVLIENLASCPSSTRRPWARPAATTATSPASPRGLLYHPRNNTENSRRARQCPHSDVRLIVVTDNERILGLGDQGAGGWAFPSASSPSIRPRPESTPCCLPVSLDVGTDNANCWPTPYTVVSRLRAPRDREYEEFIEAFVRGDEASPTLFCNGKISQEHNALLLLDRYRERLPSFNDDIQGTRRSPCPASSRPCGYQGGQALRDQRLVYLGAGAAGAGGLPDSSTPPWLLKGPDPRRSTTPS